TAAVRDRGLASRSAGFLGAMARVGTQSRVEPDARIPRPLGGPTAAAGIRLRRCAEGDLSRVPAAGVRDRRPVDGARRGVALAAAQLARGTATHRVRCADWGDAGGWLVLELGVGKRLDRSEEHTSELQSL